MKLGEVKMAEEISHVFWASHKGSRQVAEVKGKKSVGVKKTLYK